MQLPPEKRSKKPWPALEQVIAAELGLRPVDIWPSRYDAPRTR